MRCNSSDKLIQFGLAADALEYQIDTSTVCRIPHEQIQTNQNTFTGRESSPRPPGEAF